MTETGQEKEMHTREKKARAIGEITAGLAKLLIKETEAIFLKGPVRAFAALKGRGAGNARTEKKKERKGIMELSGNTILITGGTSGIGLELATQLSKRKNTILVTGRDPHKLRELQQALPNVHTYQSDVSDPAAIVSLYQRVTNDFPDLNVLINNAGVMRMLSLNGQHGFQDIGREIEINLLGPVRMVEQFLPFLKTKRHAAIINTSSGLAFVPLPSAPIYCATKAALHSYTQSLRVQLHNTHVKVFELAPPPTSTPLMKNFGSDSFNSQSPGVMNVDKMVRAALKGLGRDTDEIRPGTSNVLKFMSRLAPTLMLRQLSRPVAKELAKAQLTGVQQEAAR